MQLSPKHTGHLLHDLHHILVAFKKKSELKQSEKNNFQAIKNPPQLDRVIKIFAERFEYQLLRTKKWINLII